MDFRIDVRLPRHWKYRKLKNILGISPMENLIIFWGTVTEQVPNGALNGWSKKDVELAAEWSGTENVFCDALIESGFLDVTKSGFYPHDWEENQPWVVGSKERIESARKAGKASAAARRKKKISKPILTDAQRTVEKPLNGKSTDAQRNGNPRTPSPSPSPLTTTTQETIVYLKDSYVNPDTGEICPF